MARYLIAMIEPKGDCNSHRVPIVEASFTNATRNKKLTHEIRPHNDTFSTKRRKEGNVSRAYLNAPVLSPPGQARTGIGESCGLIISKRSKQYYCALD
jgi:hypothetical protein